MGIGYGKEGAYSPRKASFFIISGFIIDDQCHYE